MLKKAFVLCLGITGLILSATGVQVSAQIVSGPTIRTIAGRVGLGEGGPALEASLPYLGAVSVDGLGRVLVATGGPFVTIGDNRIHRIALDGTIAPVAGNGGVERSGPVLVGVTATSVALPPIGPVLGLADGSFLFGSNYGIFRVAENGMLTAFAGSARMPVVCQAQADSSSVLSVCGPRSMALAVDGSVYVADSGRNAIFAVAPSGVVRRVAGIDHFLQEPSSGDGTAAIAATIRPTGVAISGNTVYFDDGGRLRRIRFDGTLETVASLTKSLIPAPPSSTLDMLPRGVLGQTISGDVLLQGPRGVLKLRSDGLTESFVGGFGSTEDPNSGGQASASYAGSGNTVAGAPDGTVIVAQNETNEIYRVGLDGKIRRIAGRRYTSSVNANQLSLIQTNSLTKATDGSILLTEGRWSSRLWRFRNGSFTLLAGSLKPAEQLAQPRTSAFRRIIELRGIAEGCQENLYLWDINEAMRLDTAGVLHYPVESGKSRLEVISVGGTCGAMFAMDFDGRLLRIKPDDSVTFEAQFMPYTTILGTDGAGGLLLQAGPNLLRRSNDGTVTNVGFLGPAVATPGGYIGMQFGSPDSFLATLRNATVTRLARLDYTLSASSPRPPDGPLDAAPTYITRLASNPFSSWTATVMDRGFLRVISLPPVRVAATSSDGNTVTASRFPSPNAASNVVSTPRTPAPQATSTD
jgi:hypothetical protein